MLSRLSSPRFSSIYPSLRPSNAASYEAAKQANPHKHCLRPYATRIFRELPTTMALLKLVGKEPTIVHVLGCSDGSEVYAHAIAAKTLGNGKNLEIVGVDRNPMLVELARTGFIVCSDEEKGKADSTAQSNYTLSPLAGTGWNKHLILSNQPPAEFSQLTQTYPDLGQITGDPVAGIKIGQGMHWYKVNKTDLPSYQFKTADMVEYIKNSSVTEDRQQVYVLSNALAYEIKKKGLSGLTDVLNAIREKNPSKPAYFVWGFTESAMLDSDPQYAEFLGRVMRLMGITVVMPDELKRAGIINDRELETVFGNIFRIPPGPQFNFKSNTSKS